MSDIKKRIVSMTAEELKLLMEKAQTRQRFLEALSTNKPDENSIKWVEEKCNSLKQRIANLTPNRKELRDSWNATFDVDLFIQMFRNSAVDENDANTIVNIVFERIQMLCAPSQDCAIAHAKESILQEKNTSKKLAVLLEIANDIINDVEKLLKDFENSRV